MNIVRLNTVSLDGIIKKGSGGGGGGVTINNQEKSLEITENGVTEVTADAGFTGLSKVVVNTNVQSGGGGSDFSIIGDGKTYLHIEMQPESRTDISLFFKQNKQYGVAINWGDGSEEERFAGTSIINPTHKYSTPGNYTISLANDDGCTLELGRTYNTGSIMGTNNNGDGVYGSTILKYAEIGTHGIIVNNYAFYKCYNLKKVVIPNAIKYIGEYAFDSCYSLSEVTLSQNILEIRKSAFCHCFALGFMRIPNTVTILSYSAFNNCCGMRFLDFSTHTQIPTLEGTNALLDIYSNCKIVVPDELYDGWISATNWSSYASYIIKKSDWDAQNS